jgi:hypothetical protein
MENVGIFYGHLEYFAAIWYTLRPLGNFVAIWYVFKKNLATLNCTYIARRIWNHSGPDVVISKRGN